MKNKDIFVEKLRSSGLRPTKQRIEICKLLFDRKSTFHFSIDYLSNLLKEKSKEKISLATIYNTVHAFKKKGYLKEISINSNKSYFDTNVTDHHHFFNEDTNQLIDAETKDIDSIKINKNLSNQKVKSVEVLVRLSTNNQNKD